MSTIAYDEVTRELFKGALGRSIDEADLAHYVTALEEGVSLSQLIRDVCESKEFRARQPKDDTLVVDLPDLTTLYPDRYRLHDDGTTIFEARDDAGVAMMESLIVQHRYYDSFGIWAPIVDQDKRLTAAIIQALGARSVVELGCFAGAALSVMKANGLEVRGIDVSHRAFILAKNEIVHDLQYGDLLDLPIDRQFDAFLGMDILEHLSPIKLDRYVARIREVITDDGVVYINSPMFGADRTFGQVFSAYLPSWQAAGRDVYWYEMHCDTKGWPMHGHLVWASPQWWEALFQRHGLIRDDVAERLLHEAMDPFFATAPARKSLFVLRPLGATPDHTRLEADIARFIKPIIAE